MWNFISLLKPQNSWRVYSSTENLLLSHEATQRKAETPALHFTFTHQAAPKKIQLKLYFRKMMRSSCFYSREYTFFFEQVSGKKLFHLLNQTHVCLFIWSCRYFDDMVNLNACKYWTFAKPSGQVKSKCPVKIKWCIKPHRWAEITLFLFEKIANDENTARCWNCFLLCPHQKKLIYHHSHLKTPYKNISLCLPGSIASHL